MECKCGGCFTKYKRFPVTIFRPTYIYGEENNLYRETYLFDRITKGLDVPIPSGNEVTQFIYISDLVKVFESAIHIEPSVGQAYNVTHTEVVTWSQLVEKAMKVVNNNLFYYFRTHLTEKYELLWIKNFKFYY